MRRESALAEWPTVALLIATYLLWVTGTTWAASFSLPLGAVLTALAIAQFSSLQHEVLHGHPFRSQRLNEALVFPGLTLFIPYVRFRDTHLAHHHDPILTDPYDDPESNYQDPAVWAQMPGWLRAVLRFNNTLLGRLVVGPVVGTWHFIAADIKAARDGDETIAPAWGWHGLGVVMVLVWFLTVATMPFWAYLLSVYLSFSVLKIRTFLEHRAHEAARARTVIIEDRGPLALLFLNNNYHVVHHMHPSIPWYRLPATYRARREHFLRRNEGYVYRSYAQVFARYFLTAKDPVAHPLWEAQALDIAEAQPVQRAQVGAAVGAGVAAE